MRSYWKIGTQGFCAIGFIFGLMGCQWVASVDRDKLAPDEQQDSATKDDANTSAGGSGGFGGQASGGTGTGGTKTDAEADTTQAQQCETLEQCPEPESVCQKKACEEGFCKLTNVDTGTKVDDPTPGDCKAAQCDGNGGVEEILDNDDVPDDGNSCTIGRCENGEPAFDNAQKNTPCGADNKLYCDGSGKCVGCTNADQCDGVGVFCEPATCSDEGVCVREKKAAGTPLPATEQSEGDCFTKVCDGNGNVADNFTDTDVKDDGNECTKDICDPDGHQPNPPEAEGTLCNNKTNYCDGAGACVQCTAAHMDKCAQPEDEYCGEVACNSGTCAITKKKEDGTVLPVGSQITGDCHQKQCSGNGVTVSNVVDDNDKPADGACKIGKCTNGAVGYDLKPSGTPCDKGGGENGVCGESGNCE